MKGRRRRLGFTCARCARTSSRNTGRKSTRGINKVLFRVRSCVARSKFPEKCACTGFYFRRLPRGFPRGNGGAESAQGGRGGAKSLVPWYSFLVFSTLGYETFWLLAASGGFLVAPGGEKSRTLVLFWASWCPQAAKSLVPYASWRLYTALLGAKSPVP